MSKIQKNKIFLVDDDTFQLNLLKKLLQQLGYEDVTIFENGVDCMNNIHLKPEVVFLDHCMDTLTGYEVLNKIKRYDPNIFVVMVSAQEELKTAVDVLKHGAFDYLEKNAELAENVKTVMNKIQIVKDIQERNQFGILKKIFQFL